jgi:FkbM family methyltransferase
MVAMARIMFRNVNFIMDEIVEPYNNNFFSRVNGHLWEPDVICFLENNLSEECLFVDIGASTGVLTLMAASLGSSVIAYEPMIEEFHALERNLQANAPLVKKIQLRNYALGRHNSELILHGTEIEGPEKQFISEINYKSGGRKPQIIKILDSKQEVLSWGSQSKSVIVKFDIEGVEYDLFRYAEFLTNLSKLKALCLVAFHPGAMRPHKRYFPIIDRLRFELFKYRNYSEAQEVFEQVNLYGQIRLMDNSNVTSSRRFARLLDLGILSFIIDFR